MTEQMKAAISEYLKEHLTIFVLTEDTAASYGSGSTITTTVSILLGEEQISTCESEVSIYYS